MKGFDQKGALVLSLDFELYWGLRDIFALEVCRETLLGVRTAIPALLELFARHSIHATWAAVGLLFFETRQALMEGLPKVRPDYADGIFSIYPHLLTIGADESHDLFHLAPSLIKLIAAQPDQEIGTHTFSHYYCLEKGQDKEAFRADLRAAVAAAGSYQLALQSLVFPRNQYNADYIEVCKEVGIKAYRGIQSSWIYSAIENRNESMARRGLRLLDSYLNLSGHNCYAKEQITAQFPCNIPASRFLRPYSRKLKLLEGLRLKRIVDDLTYAAKHGLVYHLWWHPHNFGLDLEENIGFLERILQQFEVLRESHGMQSFSMTGLADYLLESKGKN